MKRIRTLLAAALLLLLPPALFSVVAQQVGGFSGRVIDATAGSPVPSATVTAHDPQGTVVATMTTDAGGSFTTPPLAVGVYYAKASAGPEYRDELYREIACVVGCDVRAGVRISVQSNLVMPGVDFTLNRADTSTTQASQATTQASQPTTQASQAQARAQSQEATGSPATVPAVANDGQPRFVSAGSRGAPLVARDPTLPILVMPRLVTAVAASPSGSPVAFAVTATVLAGGTGTATCQPASGSTFPIGTTLVSCSATDSQANVATGSFNVVVVPPSAAGHIRGNGRVAAGDQQHHFTFNIAKRGLRSADSSFDDDIATMVEGKIRHDRFRATLVTNAYLFDAPESVPGPQPPSGIDQAFFSGLGTWNGQTAFTFQVVVVDAGEPGKGVDTITLTIRRADGTVVASVSGSLSDGNIDSY